MVCIMITLAIYLETELLISGFLYYIYLFILSLANVLFLINLQVSHKLQRIVIESLNILLQAKTGGSLIL